MQDFFTQTSENIGDNRRGGLVSALRKQRDTLYRQKGNSSRSGNQIKRNMGNFMWQVDSR